MTTAPLTVPLVARTVPIPDPGPLLGLLPRTGPLAWVRRREGLVGWGETLRIRTTGVHRFADAEAAWLDLVDHAVVRDEVGLPGTGPVAFGSFAFSPGSAAGGVLVVPEVVVGRRGDQWWLTTTSLGRVVPSATLPETENEPVLWHGEVTFADGARTAVDWESVVAEAIRRIGAGALEKVVLARDLEAYAERPVDVRALLGRLANRYPGCWTFSVDGLVGATPEMLVRREKGLVTSRVLAGTIRRTGDDEHDLALAASLARSSKDGEEHEYAVRSVADALAPHCTSMNVPESPFVLHLANVMHLATDVTGVLRDDTTSLGLAAALHPSAAVCGTPTEVAASVISEIEGMDRDRYAGPVGWMDAQGDGEWGIALRCARVDGEDGRRLRLFAGCGIVAGSDPERELAESNDKLVPMRDALSGG
ncbi:isochorismate synthase MenF [Kineosporia sp. R_H_3]|uniref:isochorismate synthase n=1 Tax=Kineosporia sp. R_H_3 TaxID=1961848 RepID=UPI000B4AF68C|nr:isochorismate synthase [Kineosporia sp. R_H_3]